MSHDLIYPGHPEFNYWLSIPPPCWQNYNMVSGEPCLVADSQTGILRVANREEFFEYALGGEYDERLEQMEEVELVSLLLPEIVEVENACIDR